MFKECWSLRRPKKDNTCCCDCWREPTSLGTYSPIFDSQRSKAAREIYEAAAIADVRNLAIAQHVVDGFFANSQTFRNFRHCNRRTHSCVAVLNGMSAPCFMPCLSALYGPIHTCPVFNVLISHETLNGLVMVVVFSQSSCTDTLLKFSDAALGQPGIKVLPVVGRFRSACLSSFLAHGFSSVEWVAMQCNPAHWRRRG